MTAREIAEQFNCEFADGCERVIEVYAEEQLQAVREENERLRAEAKESDKQHYNLCWRIEDLRAAMKRIHVQSTRRNRGTTLKSYLLTDLEIIEDIARAALKLPAAVPAAEGGGEKG